MVVRRQGSRVYSFQIFYEKYHLNFMFHLFPVAIHSTTRSNGTRKTPPVLQTHRTKQRTHFVGGWPMPWNNGTTILPSINPVRKLSRHLHSKSLHLPKPVSLNTLSIYIYIYYVLTHFTFSIVPHNFRNIDDNVRVLPHIIFPDEYFIVFPTTLHTYTINHVNLGKRKERTVGRLLVL